MSRAGTIVRCHGGHPLLRLIRAVEEGKLIMPEDVEAVAPNVIRDVNGVPSIRCSKCGLGPDWSNISPPIPSPDEQELRDRERFMRDYLQSDGTSIWELYQMFRESLDRTTTNRCSSCGRHLWQAGPLVSTDGGPPLCEVCR